MTDEAQAPRKPVEQWAQAKGHGTITQQVGKATVRKPAPRAWVFRAAKALEGWPQGRELTEAEYDAACSRAAGLAVGR